MLRSELLANLQARLKPWLGSDDLAARLAEADQHLRDCIEAHVELGLEAMAAESEAVVAFGDVRKVADTIVRESNARSAHVRIRTLVVVFAALMVNSFIAPWLLALSIWTSLLPLATILIGTISLARTSFRSRRAIPIPLAVAGLAATLALWLLMGATTLNLRLYGGTGSMPRGVAARIASGASLPEGGVYAYVDAESLRGIDGPIARAQRDPLGNLVSMAPPAFGTGGFVFALAVLADVAAASLGLVCRRRRRTHA